jgi:hypothetical protein
MCGSEAVPTMRQRINAKKLTAAVMSNSPRALAKAAT